MDTPSIPQKRCTKCGKEFPATVENFFRQARGKYGVTAECKICHAKRMKRQKETNPAEYKRRSCEYSQRWREKHPDKYRESAHQSNKRQRQKNPQKYKDSHRQWYKANPDRAKERQKRARINNPDKYREISRLANRRWRKAHPEKVRENGKRWRVAHREKDAIKTRRRHARKRALPATFTYTDWERCLEYFNNQCAYCQRPRGLWHTLAQDHFVPVSQNGGYTPDNIVPACHGIDGCNNQKAGRDPHGWLIEKFGPRKAQQIEKRIAAYFEQVKRRE